MQKRSFRNGRLSGQVLQEMRRLIIEDYPAPGSRLPKEAELAEKFQVSRIVIREVMKILEDRGMVEVRAGRGTLTVAPKPDRVKESLLLLFRDQPMPTVEEMGRRCCAYTKRRFVPPRKPRFPIAFLPGWGQ